MSQKHPVTLGSMSSERLKIRNWVEARLLPMLDDTLRQEFEPIYEELKRPASVSDNKFRLLSFTYISVADMDQSFQPAVLA